MKRVKEFLLNNTDVLEEVVRELASWDGSMEHLDVRYNDEEFFNVFFSDPMEAVRAAHYGDYNYTDEYVRFNAYGNLETLTGYDYKQELVEEIDEIVELLVENQGNLSLDSELEELMEQAEEENEVLI